MLIPILVAAVPLVVSVRVPQELAWGTNVLTVTVRNTDARPHEIEMNVRCKSLSVGPAFQLQTKHTAAANSETTFERDFIVPAFSGKQALSIRVNDVTANEPVFRRDDMPEFPFVNQRTNPLKMGPLMQERNPALRAEYPRLRVKARGHFAVYYLEGDRYVESRLDAIAERREQSYKELAAKINPAFDDSVAVYLFPDGESKQAYTFREGDGWASGRVVVEIFNEKTQLDPYHELTHIIAGTVGRPPALFGEGLAAYLQEGHRWDGYHVDAWSKAFAAHGALWPLAKLFTFDDIGPEESAPGIAYPQAASVIRYLVSRYGFDQVMAAYKELKNDSAAVDKNREAFARIFGSSVEEIEKAWLAELAQAQAAAPPEAIIAAKMKQKK